MSQSSAERSQVLSEGDFPALGSQAPPGVGRGRGRGIAIGEEFIKIRGLYLLSFVSPVVCCQMDRLVGYCEGYYSEKMERTLLWQFHFFYTVVLC